MKFAFFAVIMAISQQLIAQAPPPAPSFSLADTLRGSITQARTGWDVMHYDITVQPNIASKSITGKTIITYFESMAVHTMQIDLQQPLVIDSITSNGRTYPFSRRGNVCMVYLRDSLAKYKIVPGPRTLTLYYHGVPVEAKRAPWQGGLVWQTDSLKRPYVATACQGLGASVWWPCKDHQSDEPDSGVTMHYIVPDSLCAIGNGRLVSVSPSANGLQQWTWNVMSPINSYDVTMNIGKYVHWNDTLMGEQGKLDVEYWVLDYDKDKAMHQFEQVKPMLRSHEYWFGPYPFYADSYKLIETPFLGMEHQSGVAYGNRFRNGYLGLDLSGTGWGLRWDFIIIHESGHEWFGNNITSKDIADMWIHEGFTNYSEVLFTETYYGKAAADNYCIGLRKRIKNDIPIIGQYGVNNEGSGDMYPKAANMIHLIRQVINNDSAFRKLLRSLSQTFFHQTVTTQQVEAFLSQQSDVDFSKVFDQYLRTTQVPTLEYSYDEKKQRLKYHWTKCVKGFNLPLVINGNESTITLKATEKWRKVKKVKAQTLLNWISNNQLYYINKVKQAAS